MTKSIESKESTASISIPPPIFQTIKEISEWEEISINAIISNAIEKYVIENSLSSLNIDETFGKGMEELLRNMISSGCSIENIFKFTSIPEETIRIFIKKQNQSNNPNFTNWAVRECKKICVMIKKNLQKEMKILAKQKETFLKDLIAQAIFDYTNNLEFKKKLTEVQIEVVQKMISAGMNMSDIVKHTKVPTILIKKLIDKSSTL